MCVCVCVEALNHFTDQVLILDTIVKTHEIDPVIDKTYKIFAPSNDSDQTGHPARLVIVFQVHTKKRTGPSLPFRSRIKNLI